MKYRLRPAEVDAWQWNGQPRAEWPAWVPRNARATSTGSLLFRSSHIRGEAAAPGDWLIHGDYVTVLSPAEFARTYERVGG